MTTTCYKNPSSPEIIKFKHETKYEMNTGLKSKKDVIKQVAYQLQRVAQPSCQEEAGFRYGLGFVFAY